MTATILRGDARALPLADASVDSIVCDPPYELGFMGRSWDSTGVAYDPATWREALRVLKPGGHLLAFGGSRTWHRLACAIEDAGFEIRDSMAWLYGSGFPKSLDVSKAIDAAAGAEREVVGQRDRYLDGRARRNLGDRNEVYGAGLTANGVADITAPATPNAARWQGWGTALKPGFEPIVVARKPLVGTVAANVLQYGTGALNIDGCRLDSVSSGPGTTPRSAVDGRRTAMAGDMDRVDYDGSAGRWPTNVVLDGVTADELDRQTGVLKSGVLAPHHNAKASTNDSMSGPNQAGRIKGTFGGDEGGASRFFPTFRYEAKAPADERPRVNGVAHPTVKPLELIRWLCRLVTPPGGLILDPFAGSGTTLEAALLEGFNVVATERDADYLPLIEYRADRARRRLQPGVARLAKAKPAAQADGQGDLLADLFGGVA